MAVASAPEVPAPPALDPALDPARDLLGTLAAGRASLMQLAAAHLPFARLVHLHRTAFSEVDVADLASTLIERRLAFERAARAVPVPAVVAPPEAVVSEVAVPASEAQSFGVDPDLSEWAAEAPAAEDEPIAAEEDIAPEPAPLPVSIPVPVSVFAEPPLPLRAPPPLPVFGGEPRAVAPVSLRVSAYDAIEAGEEAGEEAEPESDGESDDLVVEGFSVTFQASARRVAAQAVAAPRLTEIGSDDLTNPAAPLPAPPVRLSPSLDDQRIGAILRDAEAWAAKGDLVKAIQAWTDALEMRHTLLEAHIGRGRCFLELGDYSSAMSDFARAEDLNPGRPDAHVAMGDLYFVRKEYKRAIEFYDQAVEVDGSHAMARCRRGISHYYRKNYHQASQDLQRALSLDPEIPNIRKYAQMVQNKLERGG